MDVYWSVERCGWVPCQGPAEPPATTWTVEAEALQVGDLPQQRSDEPVPVER